MEGNLLKGIDATKEILLEFCITNALFYLVENHTWKAILHQNHFGFLFRTSLYTLKKMFKVNVPNDQRYTVKTKELYLQEPFALELLIKKKSSVNSQASGNVDVKEN